MQNLRRVFAMFDITTLKKFVVDREMSLINALGSCFPFARTLLCRRHINKNITAKMRRHFGSAEEFKQLQRTWNFLVQAQTTTEYDRQVIAMRVDLPAHVMRYLENN